jgi:hypothetical protein
VGTPGARMMNANGLLRGAGRCRRSGPSPSGETGETSTIGRCVEFADVIFGEDVAGHRVHENSVRR